jgi:hypothetical protein
VTRDSVHTFRQAAGRFASGVTVVMTSASEGAVTPRRRSRDSGWPGTTGALNLLALRWTDIGVCWRCFDAAIPKRPMMR